MGAASRAVVCAASCTHSVPGEYCPAGYALDRAHVNFPASSPFVLRVGGTMLSGTPPAEVVWRAAPGDQSQGGGGGSTGGGVANRSARPTVCTEITSGDNHSPGVPQGYAAGVGYDAVSGWVTPLGTPIAQLLS